MWDDDYIDRDGGLTVEGLQRLYVDIDLGIPIERSKLPDTPAIRARREQAAIEVAAIKAKSYSIDFGNW